jgi:glycine/D-amino acid oxidase-like deaminating enzyme
MRPTFDAVIIGGGIMGCSTAFELAHRGLKVAVLEKHGICTGSTGRSSAIIRQHYSNELTAAMALYGLHVFQDFDAHVGGDCAFEQTGFVALVPAADIPGLEANAALQRRVGINTELLSPEALREIIPGMATDDVVAAAYEPEGGYADPHLATTAYAEAAGRFGTKVFGNAEVTGVRFAADRVIGVDTSDGRFDAPIVINCAGPWGAAVAEMTGVTVPINACRVQVATFRRPMEFGPTHPVVLDFIHATYFRPETGNLTLVGLIDPAEADDVVDPDDYAERIDQEFVETVGERWARRYPAMDASVSTGGYAGLYAVTPDWHPIVDEAPEGSGCYISAGFSGHGFKLAPAVGLMTAEMVLGVDDPRFSPAMFRLGRYAEADLVHGQYEYSITG